MKWLNLLGAVMISFVIVPDVVAQSSTDPLELTTTFVPSVTFSETHTDSLVKSLVDPGDPGNGIPPTYGYNVVSSLSSTATITANITGTVLTDIDTTTTFSTNFGGATISFTLGNIPTYRVGQTTAFYCWNGWADGTNKLLGTNGVKLTWTATKLTVTITMGNEDPTMSSRPSQIASEGFAGTATDPGTFPIKDIVTADLTFGAISASLPRNVYFTGKYTVTPKTIGDPNAPDFDGDLYTVSVSGAADYTRPTVVLTSPKQGASVGAAVDVHGTASDAVGLSGAEWTTDLNAPWNPTDLFTYTSQPADGLWGPTAAAWTVSLASLPHGTTRLWVRSVDASGNTSTPLLITLVYPMPAVLTGRWDALLVPDALNPLRGAINFTFAVNGSYTGTLVVEGASYPFTGTLQPDESLVASISRSKLSPVSLNGTIASFSPVGAGDAGLAATLSIAGTSVATFNAFRSPWSTANLAAASLAGSFHVQIDPATAPIGNSYAVVTTARAGGASAVFSLADGSVATWSGVMGATGELPAFASLYVTVSKTGTTAGSVSASMNVNGAARTINPTTVTWVRPPSFTDKQFPLGFHYDTLAASGIAYTAPSPATVRVMGLGTTTPNATVSWNGDGVTTSPTLGITVKTSNALFIPAGLTLNPNTLALALAPSTGLWTGSFKIPGTTAVSACKLIIVGNQAYGFWTAPAPTGSVLKRYGLIHIQ